MFPELLLLLLLPLLPLLPLPLPLFCRTADEVDELLLLLLPPLLLLPALLLVLLLVDCWREGRRLAHQMRTVVSSEALASMFG